METGTMTNLYKCAGYYKVAQGTSLDFKVKSCEQKETCKKHETHNKKLRGQNTLDLCVEHCMANNYQSYESVR